MFGGRFPRWCGGWSRSGRGGVRRGDMTRYLLLVVVLAAGPERARAEWLGLRAFDAPNYTWVATHVVLVEDGKVVESWKGDLKPGDPLPDGAAAHARVRPPAVDPGWLKRSGENHPPVTGKRLVLFLQASATPPWSARSVA